MITEKSLPSMLKLLEELVVTESPSQDRSAVNKVGKIITKEAKEIGATIKIIQNETTGDHIITTFNHSTRKTEKEEKKGFLILCHMDTVYPIGAIDRMPFHLKDSRILGPGVADMKSGAVIGLFAIKNLIEEGQMPNMPVTILFTSDEETGSRTSRKLIEELAVKSRLVLVLEPGMPDGSIKTWRKGVGNFHIEVYGQAAHSGGNHEKGRNAIEELAHQVIRVQGLTNYNRGTTLNVGICKGGTVVNVVPDLAWMDVDLRVLDPG
ncbi:M20/M25/M40 family metallo-hydrolase [Chloroflexota bacterium]